MPPGGAKTKNGDRFMKLGAKAEAKQDYDAALNYYEQAVEEDSPRLWRLAS